MLLGTWIDAYRVHNHVLVVATTILCGGTIFSILSCDYLVLLRRIVIGVHV